MKLPVRIVLGETALEIRKTCLLLWPKAGNQAHLTLHYAPNPSGTRAGLHTPHVTLARQMRRTLAAISPKKLEQFFEKFGNDLARHWLASVRLVDLHELAGDGWRVVLIPDEKLREVAQSFRAEDGSFRLELLDACERWGDLMIEHLAPLDELERWTGGQRTAQVVRISDEDFKHAQLFWLPSSPDGDPSGAGWYRLPDGWPGTEYMNETFSRHVGGRFFRALRVMCRLLRLPIDEERVATMERLSSRSASSVPASGSPTKQPA